MTRPRGKHLDVRNHPDPSLAMRCAALLAACATALAPSPAKVQLLKAIETFKEATDADGNVPIDFGVKGGELDGDTRAPRNLFPDGFRAVSGRVGDAADVVMKAVDALAAEPSLAEAATASWPDPSSPLDGEWSNLWTTAADATFDARSERGAARVSNVVDAKRGKITNVIAFESPTSKVDTLKVRLRTKAIGNKRLQLTFLRVKVTFRKRLLGIFRSIYIPVPSVLISRLIFLFKRKMPPRPFFDLLFLDKDLRVQRTGEGNVFIQRRPGVATAAAPT